MSAFENYGMVFEKVSSFTPVTSTFPKSTSPSPTIIRARGNMKIWRAPKKQGSIFFLLESAIDFEQRPLLAPEGGFSPQYKMILSTPSSKKCGYNDVQSDIGQYNTTKNCSQGLVSPSAGQKLVQSPVKVHCANLISKGTGTLVDNVSHRAIKILCTISIMSWTLTDEFIILIEMMRIILI